MRTTINVDDDALELAKRYAEMRSLGLGKAVSELVRRAMSGPVKTRTENGVVIFDLPDDEIVTNERIKKLEVEGL